MGDRLGEQDGYPAGVSNADFAGAGDDDAPCTCGHLPVEHFDEDGHCLICGAVDCPVYEPIEDV